MTRPVAAVVPPRAASSSREPARALRLPVTDLLPLPRTGSLRYGMARLDGSGVVSNRSTVQALGWRRGDRLQITLVVGSVLVHRTPSGAFAKPYLVLPAPVRHRAGLRPGEQVLVTADPNHDAPIVHPLAALDAMLVAYHTTLAGGR